MKRKLFFTIALSALLLSACDEEGDRVIFQGGTAMQLTASSTADLVLSKAQEDFNSLQFQWTNPNFRFSNGVNTQNVTYELQIDEAGNNFEGDKMASLSFSQVLSTSFKVKDLNSTLAGIRLPDDAPHEFEFRVRASLGNAVEPVYSNVVTITISTYSIVFPPIYLMGAAVNGWGPWNDREMEAPSIEADVYETVVYITTGETFRFFAQKDWGPTSYNYPFFSSVDTEFENSNDDDKNLRLIAATGYYRITVNLDEKTVVAEPVSAPVLYMTGAGVNDWNWNEGVYVQLTYTNRKAGVFEVTHQFKADNTFRFFAQPDWSPTSYNYPYFSTVDPLFVNGNDDDSNLRYVGESNVNTKIRVDLNAKTVTVIE